MYEKPQTVAFLLIVLPEREELTCYYPFQYYAAFSAVLSHLVALRSLPHPLHRSTFLLVHLPVLTTCALITCLVSDNEQSKFKFWFLISKFGFGGFPVAYWDARWGATLWLWFDILYCSPHTLFVRECQSYCVWLCMIMYDNWYGKWAWYCEIVRTWISIHTAFHSNSRRSICYRRYYCIVNSIDMIGLTTDCHLFLHDFHGSRCYAHGIGEEGYFYLLVLWANYKQYLRKPQWLNYTLWRT